MVSATKFHLVTEVLKSCCIHSLSLFRSQFSRVSSVISILQLRKLTMSKARNCSSPSDIGSRDRTMAWSRSPLISAPSSLFQQAIPWSLWLGCENHLELHHCVANNIQFLTISARLAVQNQPQPEIKLLPIIWRRVTADSPPDCSAWKRRWTPGTPDSQYPTLS